MCPISDTNTNHIVIAVDPSGGGSSQFAVFSLVQLPTGTIMVRRPEIAKILPSPHLRQHRGEYNKRPRALAIIFEKSWSQKREHALLQIYGQLGIMRFTAFPMVASFVFSREGVEQHRTLACDTSPRGTHIGNCSDLKNGLPARLVIAVNVWHQLKQCKQMGVDSCCDFQHIVFVSFPQRSSEQQRAQTRWLTCHVCVCVCL